LELIVGRCTNFIFVLSDNVFDSPWCIKELEAAVRNEKNIILVTKDGSRWKDANGSKTCLFPPYEIINALPEEAQKAFVSKAVAHSDEYYQAFKDQLIRRIKRPIVVGAAAESAEVSDAAGMGKRAPSQADLTRGMSNNLDSHGVVISSERNVSQEIIATERSLRDQINALGRDFSRQVQEVEGRLSEKFEARIREVKENVLAISHGVRDAIIDLNSSKGAYSRAFMSAQPHGAQLSQSPGGAPISQAQYFEDQMDGLVGQRQAENGSSSHGSSPMATRSPAATRTSRLFSARPQSGSPAHRSPSNSQGGFMGTGWW